MKKNLFLSVLVGSVTSGGLFLIILCLLWFESTARVGFTVAYFWIAPALLLQGRPPSAAVSDIGVGPPDLTTWIICILFWAIIGALIYIRICRMISNRHLILILIFFPVIGLLFCCGHSLYYGKSDDQPITVTRIPLSQSTDSTNQPN